MPTQAKSILPMSTRARKGFRIFHLEPRPYQLLATGMWTVEIEIRRKGRLCLFSGSQSFPTEAEATAASLALGRRIVAGEEPGCSLANLE